MTARNNSNAADVRSVSKSGSGRRRLGRLSTLFLIVLGAWVVWSWGFCRFYVAPGKMAIITAKSGKPLPAGQILAEPGQQGVRKDVLGEGRHIWNPLFYDWEIVDAQFIPPGKIGIVTSLIGEDLPVGEFLAKEGQKGTWRQVLGPGCYRFNPKGYRIELVDAVGIPLGFAGIVTSQSALAAKPGESGQGGAESGTRGTRTDVLQPGMYYINPREYRVDAVEVGVNQVSLLGAAGSVMLTKNVGLDANNQMIQRLNQNTLDEYALRRAQLQEELNQRVAPSGRSEAAIGMESMVEALDEDPGRLVRQKIAKAKMPVPQTSAVSQGQRRAMERNVPPAFVINEVVKFLSQDAFNINLDMTVEFELPPGHLAEIYRRVGDLPTVVVKQLMPKIVSVSQNRGGSYRAVDFIAGLGREKFQNDLTESLQASVLGYNLRIHSALISNVNVPMQILEPLRVTSLSRQTELTNKEKQNTAKKQAELNREMSMIQQSGAQVAQETFKLKAQIHAEMEKAVATTQAETVRQMAAIDKRTAMVMAERTLALGKAEVEAIRMVDAEQAKGFGMKVRAFGKDGGEYALYEFAMQLNPNLAITLIHAGEGTLWTDLKKASLAEIGGARAASGKKTGSR